MSKTITLAEVAEHKERNSCWVVIHNKVYDVTKFLDEHPGGEEVILDVGGRFGSEPFEDVGHSEDARELLEQYLIGELPPEEHEVKDVRDELAFPDQKNMFIFAVPVVLGIIAMVAWKYRHLFMES